MDKAAYFRNIINLQSVKTIKVTLTNYTVRFFFVKRHFKGSKSGICNVYMNCARKEFVSIYVQLLKSNPGSVYRGERNKIKQTDFESNILLKKAKNSLRKKSQSSK